MLTFAIAVPFGAGIAAFIAASNSIFAERTNPDMRGRVLALGAVLFLGSAPIGAPITGWIGDYVSASWSMFYGAADRAHHDRSSPRSTHPANSPTSSDRP